MSLLALPHPWADAVILGVLSLYGSITGFKRSPAVLTVLVLAVTFSAFWIPAGTKLGGATIVPVAVFAGVALRRLAQPGSNSALRIPKGLLLVLLALGGYAMIAVWLAPPRPPGAPAGLQAPSVRPIVQAASYALVLLFFLIPTLVRIELSDLRDLAVKVQAFIAADAAYGIYQLLAHRLGLPFRGIEYFTGAGGRQGVGVMSAAGAQLWRMSGLSNEPKQLAALTLVGLVMALMSRGLYESDAKRYLVLGLCATGFVGAWSTGGMLAALVLLATGLAWTLGSPAHAVRRVTIIAVAAVAVALVGAAALGGFSHGVSVFKEVAFGRVSIPGLHQAQGASPRIENAVVRYFEDHPLTLITGLGLGQYPYIVGPPGRWSWAGGIQPMHSLPLTLLADFGVVSLVLLGAALLRGFRTLGVRGLGVLNTARQALTDPIRRTIVGGLTAAAVVSIFLNTLPLVLVFLGAAASWKRLGRSMGNESGPAWWSGGTSPAQPAYSQL